MFFIILCFDGKDFKLIMYVNNRLIEFLNMSSFISRSNIFLTDLEKVIFISSNASSDYLNNVLSIELKKILNLYINDTSCADYLNVSMDNIVPIFWGDTAKYMSQIILPIVTNCVVAGLLIFTADDRKYLPSNLKYAKTTKQFAEVLIG